jgi:hypothetical protein
MNMLGLYRMELGYVFLSEHEYRRRSMQGGGGNPYPPEMREMVLAAWQNGGGVNGGNAALRNPTFVQLRLQGKFPHYTTCMNWIKIHQLEGHVRPMRATGNFFSEREINGVDLFNLTPFA